MITPVKHSTPNQKTPAWHSDFLKRLPIIHRQARFAFRHLDPEARAEATQEIAVSSLVAYVRLVERGKADIVSATTLANYAIAQFRCGRRIGCPLNVRDVSSPYAQMRKNFRLQRLDHYRVKEQDWQSVLVEDKRATPADVAAVRIDFAVWLKILSRRLRRIAKTLAIGETTAETARKFCVTPGRISQIRQELRVSWQTFQGETTATEVMVATGN